MKKVYAETDRLKGVIADAQHDLDFLLEWDKTGAYADATKALRATIKAAEASLESFEAIAEMVNNATEARH